MITYQELEKLAEPIFKEKRIQLSKINVGIWARLNDYTRIRKLIDGKLVYLYIKD